MVRRRQGRPPLADNGRAGEQPCGGLGQDVRKRAGGLYTVGARPFRLRKPQLPPAAPASHRLDRETELTSPPRPAAKPAPEGPDASNSQRFNVSTNQRS